MDYDDGPRTSARVKARPEVSSSHSGRNSGPFTPPVPAPQPPSVGTFQRLAQAGQDLLAQTLRPVAVQRRQIGPVLTALALQREVGSDLTAQRQSLQRQLAEGQAALPAGAVEQALQRRAEEQGTVPALTRPPAGPGDWTQLALHEAQRVHDSARPGTTRWMSGPERERHVGTLRNAGQGLAQGFRTDRGPAAQRYAEYGSSLATLQRQALTGGIPRMVLAQVSPAERPHLQRALDEALQRRSEQDGQDRAALHLHALQRQAAELDRQAEGTVVQRIEARRGSGQPLPEEIRRSLEAGLNHDLSGVRLHTDAEADLIAKKLNALAFTSGHDI